MRVRTLPTKLSHMLISGSRLWIDVEDDEQFKYHGTVHRTCNVVPKHLWTVKWIKPDGSEVNSDDLRLTNIGPTHSGEYKCIATYKRDPTITMNTGFNITLSQSNRNSSQQSECHKQRTSTVAL